MRSLLPVLAWTLAITFVVMLAAWILLKWIAVRIARRVGELAESHIAATIEGGLTRGGIRIPGVADAARRERYLKQIDRLAWLMDRAIPLPVVGGVGLDALLGLIPGAGDAISFAISSIIVIRAAQLGVSESVISRLVAIQTTDLLLGLVPVAGDLLDISYQADQKSAALIREFVERRVH
jgi:hypothetical protein